MHVSFFWFCLCNGDWLVVLLFLKFFFLFLPAKCRFGPGVLLPTFSLTSLYRDECADGRAGGFFFVIFYINDLHCHVGLSS